MPAAGGLQLPEVPWTLAFAKHAPGCTLCLIEAIRGQNLINFDGTVSLLATKGINSQCGAL